MSSKAVSSVIDLLNEAQLATLVEACGYAIRNNSVLSAALAEVDAQIPHLRDEDGNFNDEYENILDDFELATLSILVASKLTEVLSKNKATV